MESTKATSQAPARSKFLAQPVLLWLQLANFAIGASFWMMAQATDQAFGPAVYGDLAVSLPAEFWAALCMGGSMICAIGLLDPVKRWMVTVGSAVMIVNYFALSYSAAVTGGEMVVSIHATWVFVSCFYGPMFFHSLRA